MSAPRALPAMLPRAQSSHPTVAHPRRANASLLTLSLSSNMLYGRETVRLAAAIEGHASLTSLALDHNPIRDGGGVAALRSEPGAVELT